MMIGKIGKMMSKILRVCIAIISWGVIFIKDVRGKCRPDDNPLGAVGLYGFLYVVAGWLAHMIFTLTALWIGVIIWLVLGGVWLIYLGVTFPTDLPPYESQNRKQFVSVLVAMWMVGAIAVAIFI